MTLIHKAGTLFSIARNVFKKEGLYPLLRQGFTFVTGFFIQYAHYYLYEHTLRERNESDYLPKIQIFTFKLVSSNREVDELVAEGFEDFRQYFINGRWGLDASAMAFCFFVDRELASIQWVAMTERAKNTFDPIPYRVDFASKEACIGGSWTHPKCRGKHLLEYGKFKIHQFLMEKGVTTLRSAVVVSNIASQRAVAGFNPRVYARGRHLKILRRWEFWKETPLVRASKG